MGVLKEFKEFAITGNVVDTAIGIIVGGAFTPIAQSLVNDLLMPPLGMLLGQVDFQNLFLLLKPGQDGARHYVSLEAAKAAGAVTLNYGMFVNTVVSFLILAFAVFMLVKGINRLRREEKQHAPKAETEA